MQKGAGLIASHSAKPPIRRKGTEVLGLGVGDTALCRIRADSGPTLTTPAENGSHPPESRYLRLASRSGSSRGPLPSAQDQCAEGKRKADPAPICCSTLHKRQTPPNPQRVCRPGAKAGLDVM